MFHVRPFVPDDRAFVLGMASRLAIGMQPWRDLALWHTTVEGWLTESINQHNQKTIVLIAEDEQGERVALQPSRIARTLPVNLRPTLANWQPVKRLKVVESAPLWLKRANFGLASRAIPYSRFRLALRIHERSTFTIVSAFRMKISR
jgi:hypothetical protein